MERIIVILVLYLTLSVSIHGQGTVSVDFETTSNCINGRKVIYSDSSAMLKSYPVSGKVTLKTCVNQAGLVTYTELINAETTIKDKNKLRSILKSAYRYKFKPDFSGDKEQCCKIVFIIENVKK